MDIDLIGMEEIAYGNWERPISDLPAGRGSMPGKPLQRVLEGKEDVLVSGRGCVP